ncbi:glycosyltransferase [Pedobacter sp. G11]|uniref:glycosyltransferase family 4 protein n=1 Tax=Pedobacter sp. G11 TaxID=2482728 RepID=UPI000F601AA2|nr:glycosyltransferase family 4 protein [Pedobacter sp. G11]AZI25833.1 glycosyltransferase [Pedobacter sp. G11]
MKKLAIVVSHPIQYYAPVFERLSKACILKVFYTLGAQINEEGISDEGFNQKITWDIPLLSGYDYEIVKNTAKQVGHHYYGIKNKDLIAKIGLFAPDAVLVYGWAYTSHLKILKYFKGKIPIWFRGDSNLLDSKNQIKSLFRKLFLKWLYHDIDKAFYVGTANKNYFLAYGLTENQLIFAPHAIDNERFSKKRSNEAQKLRHKLTIDPADNLILFAGKFERKKNPNILLTAFIELDQPGMHLLFVGTGVLEENLKLTVEKLKSDNPALSKRIHFLDFQNQTQMPIFYQACDVFCLPSQGPNETWGLAINEAMAAGKAILASDKVGCATDLVKNNENGFIFKSGDISDLKNKISKLNKKAMLHQFGNRSRTIIAPWNFDRQCEIIINQFNGKRIH